MDAAFSCAASREGLAKAGSQSGAADSGGSAIVSSVPSPIKLSMTPLEQAAASASAALEKARPPSAAAIARARAGVMRGGGGPLSSNSKPRRFRPRLKRRANRHAQHHAARAQCPARHPIDEFSQMGGNRGNIEAA